MYLVFYILGVRFPESKLDAVLHNLKGIGAGYEWTAPYYWTETPPWMGSDKVTLISGMPKGNPFQKQDSQHPLKGEGISSWDEAVTVARSMGNQTRHCGGINDGLSS